MSDPQLQELVRGVITSGDVGTVGAGLVSQDQFDAIWTLSEDKIPWAQIQATIQKTAFTGTVNTIDYGDNVIRPAAEAIDVGTLVEQTSAHVPYTMVKGRVAFAPSFEATDQAANDLDLVNGFTRAFGRSMQKCAWNGDDTTVVVDDETAMLVWQDGWGVAIAAGGHQTDGSTINAGDISEAHFSTALASLPTAWMTRWDELKWSLGVKHYFALIARLSGRPTGVGDNFLTYGAKGQLLIYGIEAVMNPFLTTVFYLTHPKNTTTVVHPRAMTFTKVDSGATVKLADIVLYILHVHADFIVREADGTARVHTLNAI